MLKIDDFLLKQPLDRINRSFLKDGWITVYESSHENPENSILIFACLVDRSYLEKFMENRRWGIEPGREGKPAVFGGMGDGQNSIYRRFSEDHLEPLLFSKYFTHTKERYIDISEDFVNYFQLYEQLQNKQNRQYFFTDERVNKKK